MEHSDLYTYEVVKEYQHCGGESTQFLILEFPRGTLLRCVVSDDTASRYYTCDLSGILGRTYIRAEIVENNPRYFSYLKHESHDDIVTRIIEEVVKRLQKGLELVPV